jgi:23S rRNA maturation-related 3'-5' exoribonuclease YhaM
MSMMKTNELNIDIEKNKNEILSLLMSINRPGKERLIDWLKSTDFFTAPCSTKYHLSCEGGLAQHALCCYETFRGLNMLCNTGLNRDTLIIAALLHDVCKIDRYEENKDFSKNNAPYKIKSDKLPVGHGEKSVILLQRFIKLTPLEIVMIRWHMTGYEPGWSKHSFAVQDAYPAAPLLYFADHISTLYKEDSNVKAGFY